MTEKLAIEEYHKGGGIGIKPGENLPVKRERLSEIMAAEYQMDDEEFRKVIKNTVMPNPNVTNEHITAFLVLAKEYEMNPFSEQIHAFPHRNGIKLIVGYDGYIQVANRQPTYEGFELTEDFNDKDDLVRVGCQIFRSDRKHNPVIYEYMTECKRSTDAWKQMPKRMLRNKAVMQSIRAAYGLTNLIDRDEAGDMGYDATGVKIVNDEKEGEDLEAKLLEAAAGKGKKKGVEDAPKHAPKKQSKESQNPVKTQSDAPGTYDPDLRYAEGETVSREIETRDGPVTMEIGPTPPSPMELAIRKISSFTRRRDLEAHLKVGKAMKWPAQFTEAEVKDLASIAEDRLKEL